MSGIEQICPVCKQMAQVGSERSSALKVECPACGQFSLPRQYKNHDWQGKGYLLSAILRRASDDGTPMQLEGSIDIDALLRGVSLPDGPLEQMDWILLYAWDKTEYAGQPVQFDVKKDYPLFFARKPEELGYLLCCIRKRGWFEPAEDKYLITPQGWKRIAELKRTATDSAQAFVAFWFDHQMDDAVNGIFEALKDTGYEPVSAKTHQHNEDINNWIIARIRESGLLVADFTGHRGGVYFEAGFAMGLGIPVIWTCKETDVDKCHFDTRQYNHICWKDAEDLKKKLINRIEATLPNRRKRAFD